MENVPKCPLNLSTKTNCQYKKKIMFILLNKISLFIQFNLYNMHAYFQAEYAFFFQGFCAELFLALESIECVVIPQNIAILAQ